MQRIKIFATPLLNLKTHPVIFDEYKNRADLSDEGNRNDVGADFSLHEKDDFDADGEDGVGDRDRQRVHQPRPSQRRLLESDVGDVGKPDDDDDIVIFNLLQPF